MKASGQTAWVHVSLHDDGQGCLLITAITVSLVRKTMRPYVFRDGTYVPEGMIVTASQTASHTDHDHFEDADRFDGFRFCRARRKAAEARDTESTSERLEEEAGSDDWEYRLTSTSTEFLAFGGGKHVW